MKTWPGEYDVIVKKLTFLQSKVTCEVAIFRDNGWGDDPESGGSSYSVILGGNGQIDFGQISKECFDKLLIEKVIEHNTLQTYKDRGYHKFLGVPK